MHGNIFAFIKKRVQHIVEIRNFMRSVMTSSGLSSKFHKKIQNIFDLFKTMVFVLSEKKSLNYFNMLKINYKIILSILSN